jgi:hypothetical protein
MKCIHCDAQSGKKSCCYECRGGKAECRSCFYIDEMMSLEYEIRFCDDEAKKAELKKKHSEVEEAFRREFPDPCE